MPTAYPRVCGATVIVVVVISQTPGLSPRVRGNRAPDQCHVSRCGPIPACAGQPSYQGADCCLSAAYPRVCGATGYTGFPPKDGQGLSPRVRGNRIAVTSVFRTWGPIPACAGQPLNHLCRYYCPRAYPRVCGATASSSSTSMCPWGLSPRVRGNRAGAGHHCAGVGPIPACAGQPASRRVDFCHRGAYPRVCGATPFGGRFSRRAWGLSPRVRGNPARQSR